MGYHYPSYIATQHPTQLMPTQQGRLQCQGGRRLPALPAGTAQPPAMLCVENREGLSGPPCPGTQPSRAGVGGVRCVSPSHPFTPHALLRKREILPRASHRVLGGVVDDSREEACIQPPAAAATHTCAHTHVFKGLPRAATHTGTCRFTP